mmetsp:Transcript_23682/g.67720  ORF Transcript_23682/g.67720 Transcript_23682/m.67720 type:complete len:207 (-) Transcript_23682:1234-1854(-)
MLQIYQVLILLADQVLHDPHCQQCTNDVALLRFTAHPQQARYQLGDTKAATAVRIQNVVEVCTVTGYVQVVHELLHARVLDDAEEHLLGHGHGDLPDVVKHGGVQDPLDLLVAVAVVALAVGPQLLRSAKLLQQLPRQPCDADRLALPLVLGLLPLRLGSVERVLNVDSHNEVEEAKGNKDHAGKVAYNENRSVRVGQDLHDRLPL